MSEIRQDILTGEWVIFATNRKKRPYDYIKKSTPKDVECTCSFCPGHEDLTTESVFQNGQDNDWTIRVFPNMYPAVSLESEQCNDENFYTGLSGKGFHEVIVDTPNHNEAIHSFTVSHLAEIIGVIKEQFDAIRKKDNVNYVQVFKNCGPDSGASIVHSHWQIMGIPVIPKHQQNIIISSSKYLKENGRCIFCDIIKHELESKVRVIEENELFVAFVPYAAKMSYELWIMPKKHISTISEFDEDYIESFAEILKNMLSKIKEICDGISYNICFQDMPQNEDFSQYFHWYARLVPRMGNLAGFEFATGSFINHVLPENAAKFYKSLD